MNVQKNDEFYVVAYEAGAENPTLPSWANRSSNPAGLAVESTFDVSQVQRIDIPQVPGAFQLLNVLTQAECQSFIKLTEQMGYLEDAAVSLPREVRHNDNVVWITDEQTDQIIWQRVTHLVNRELTLYGNQPAVGLNARFRFYRYDQGDYFRYHTDGAWPGSRVINEQLIQNAYPDRYSQATFLIYLNDDFTGGATQFLVNGDDPNLPSRQAQNTRAVDVRTPAGGVLCFPHGMHPLHCVHSSEPIQSGIKYIIRSDVLFTL